MLTGIPTETQSALEAIVRSSVNFRYVDTVAKAAKVQVGEIIILDDGGATKRMYVRTGKDRVIYFTGT